MYMCVYMETTQNCTVTGPFPSCSSLSHLFKKKKRVSWAYFHHAIPSSFASSLPENSLTISYIRSSQVLSFHFPSTHFNTVFFPNSSLKLFSLIPPVISVVINQLLHPQYHFGSSYEPCWHGWPHPALWPFSIWLPGFCDTWISYFAHHSSAISLAGASPPPWSLKTGVSQGGLSVYVLSSLPWWA